MKKYAREHWVLLIALLALGVFINIGIALMCAVWADRGFSLERGVLGWTGEFVTSANRAWLNAATGRTPNYRCHFHESAGLDRRVFFEDFQIEDHLPWFDRGPMVAVTRAGWPYASLRAEQWLENYPDPPSAQMPPPTVVSSSSPSTWFTMGPPRSPPTPVYRVHLGIPLSLPDRLSPTGIAQRPLPLMPIWSGFIANTLLFAGGLWLLVGAPPLLRRTLRVRRGRCGNCGYPIGTSPVCTECGRAVEPHADLGPLLTPRRIVLLTICVVLGILSSVITAWGCALWSPIVVSKAEPHRLSDSPWWSSGPTGEPTDRGWGLGIEVNRFSAGSWNAHVIRCGVPFAAWEYAVEFWQNDRVRVQRVYYGRVMPAWMVWSDPDRQNIPRRPLWIGIIADALVHATMWVGVFWLIAKWRRRISPMAQVATTESTTA